MYGGISADTNSLCYPYTANHQDTDTYPGDIQHPDTYAVDLCYSGPSPVCGPPADPGSDPAVIDGEGVSVVGQVFNHANQ